ncbi:serine/threonine-protein kinase [uncultured Paludibaculum sp.]|uniref:serine/threonine-protein kinase n=1 Tax=uncultured Paludibaculum sp. TaxID=1765020 RepID=UPI002AAB8D4E|nr:serine/threonine-protein kinase [uncultured Paludibaculum sp.]
MDDRWERIQDLFVAAAGLPSSERRTFLDEACGDDDLLRAEVESLLDAEQGAGGFVEEAFGRAAVKLAAPGPRMVGAYRILKEIGRGGMGAVYLAERADQQYHKRVAIKMARFSGYGEFVHERFRHERQILATLEHPNIARLLDGGETDDGLPYIVMEYIEGRPVTDFAVEHALDVRARLELFLKIAAAVQYAHRFLVIHRDLKPSNILVTASGEPKLLDFGIAKLLEPGAMQEAIMHTSTGMRLLTPDYASPEQVRGESVTTASDVYSLGVVLYELLSGTKPHRLKDYTPLEIDRAVCEEETERPSTAAARTGAFSRLDAELDVIVLEAMHKDPARRYASVEHLADDLRRYLTGLPIQARRDSRAYRARKFLRRHRVASTAAALLVVTLVAAAGVTSWQASVARQQARRAEMRFRQVRQLANRFLFDFDEQIRNLEGSTPARESLVKTASEYLDSLATEAANDVELRTELALAYRKLGDVQGGPRSASLGRSSDALKSYRKSVEIGRGLFDAGIRNPELLQQIIEAERMLGLLEHRLREKDGDDQYERRLTESLTLAEALVEQRPDLASLRILASLYRELGERFADSNRAVLAEQRYAQALPVYEKVRTLAPGARSERGVALVTQRLGDAKVMRGDLDGALRFYRDALQRFSVLAQALKAGQAERRSVLSAHLSVGALLGDPLIPNLCLTADAIHHTGAALDIAEDLAGVDPANRTAKLDLAYTAAQYGRVLRSTQPDVAVRHLRRAVEVSAQVLATSPDDRVYQRHVLSFKTDLGAGLAAVRKTQESIAILKAVAADLDAVKDPSPSYRLIGAAARRELAAQLRLEQPDESRRLTLQALGQVEGYLLQHLDSLEMLQHLSALYEAAAWFDGSYTKKARQLWLDWPRHGTSSAFDHRRLKEIGGQP